MNSNYGHSDANNNEVKPIPIKSEKQLKEEFESISDNLKTLALDWSIRFNNIQKIQGILLGTTLSPEAISKQFLNLAPSLSVQLMDLRSSISLESSKTVCMAAEILGRTFENVADKLITKDCLIKMINNGNRIIADGAHDCIIAMLTHVHSLKIIPKLMEELTSKNQSMRIKLSKYLEIILDNFQAFQLEKIVPLIENSIVITTSDANPQARANGRQSFFIYQSKFPKQAKALFQKFGPSVQKALETDERAAEDKTSPQSQPDLKSRFSFKPESTNLTHSGVEEKNKLAKNSAIKMKSSDNVKDNIKKDEFKKKKENEIIDSEEDADQKKDNNNTAKSNNIIQKSTKNQLNKLSSSDAGQNNRTSLQKSNFSANTKTSNDNRKISKERESVDTNTSTPLTKSKYSQDEQQQSPKILKKQLNKFTVPPKNESKGELGKTINYYQKIKEDDLHLLLESCHDNNWATRMTSVDRIIEVIAEINGEGHTQINKKLFGGVINMLIDLMLDSHHRVQISALKAINKMFTFYENEMKVQLEKILNNLLLLLTKHEEEMLQTEGKKFLKFISSLYPLSLLLTYSVQSFKNIEQEECIKLAFIILLSGLIQAPEELNKLTKEKDKKILRDLIELLGDMLSNNVSIVIIAKPCYELIKEVVQNMADGYSFLSAMANSNLLCMYKFGRLYDEPSSNYVKQLEILTKKAGNGNSLKGTIEIKKSAQKDNMEESKGAQKIENSSPSTTIKDTKEQLKVDFDYTDQTACLLCLQEIEKILRGQKENPKILTDNISNIYTNLYNIYVHIKNRKIQTIVINFFKLLLNLNALASGAEQRILNYFVEFIEDGKDIQNNNTAVEELINMLCEVGRMSLTVPCLVNSLQTSEEPARQILLRCLSSLIKNVVPIPGPKQSLNQIIGKHLSALMKIISDLINDNLPEVRKSAVFFLVDLSFLISEDEFNNYLSNFTQGQQKLVTIYIKRRLENNNI